MTGLVFPLLQTASIDPSISPSSSFFLFSLLFYFSISLPDNIDLSIFFCFLLIIQSSFFCYRVVERADFIGGIGTVSNGNQATKKREGSGLVGGVDDVYEGKGKGWVGERIKREESYYEYFKIKNKEKIWRGCIEKSF